MDDNVFLILVFINSISIAWNISLLDSRDFWRKKWEEEINK